MSQYISKVSDILKGHEFPEDFNKELEIFLAHIAPDYQRAVRDTVTRLLIPVYTKSEEPALVMGDVYTYFCEAFAALKPSLEPLEAICLREMHLMLDKRKEEKELEQS